jgi:hypothetical protein
LKIIEQEKGKFAVQKLRSRLGPPALTGPAQGAVQESGRGRHGRDQGPEDHFYDDLAVKKQLYASP